MIWTLIMVFHFQASLTSSTAVVLGFSSEQTCLDAGNAASQELGQIPQIGVRWKCVRQQ